MAAVIKPHSTSSSVDYGVSDPVLPTASQHLIEDIMQDEPFLNAAVDVLQQHRNLLLINNLLQVLLELDLGCTLYFVSKACEREAETAVKKMLQTLSTNPRMNVLAAVSPHLFRETSSNILVIVEFFRITGTSYLQTVLQDMIVAVESHAKFNGASAMDAPASLTPERTDKLMALTSQMVNGILKTPPSKLPATLRYVAKFMYSTLVLQMAEKGYSLAGDESLALLQLVVSHLLGVRFFCLGLTCPALFLLPEPRSEFSQDSLITLSNILLGLMGITTNKNDLNGASPLHLHVSELSSDCEQFFANAHKNKAFRDTIDAQRSQLMNWLAQVGDFNELENRPTGPLAFFALETYGSFLARWICEYALDFILGCPSALEHRPLYEFFAANRSLIAQMDHDRTIIKPQMVLGPGIWNSMHYGKSWNFEIKLPTHRTQDMFVWIPTTVSIHMPAPDRSILEWVLRQSTETEFLLLIFVQQSTKIAAGTQKYVRSWKKAYADVHDRRGQLMAIVHAPLSQSNYVCKKLSTNFPIVFDHHEHVASHFHVAGHGPNLTGAEDVTVILVHGGRMALGWESAGTNTPLPNPKIVMSTVQLWLKDALHSKGKKPGKKNGGSEASSDSESLSNTESSVTSPR